jgi:hypothetical protein
MELSRRAAAENQGTALGDFLQVLYAEIVDDRRTLRAVMNALGIDASPVKPAGAWLLERAGRLKLNGQLRGYSPLSPLVELEVLRPGCRASVPSGRSSDMHFLPLRASSGLTSLRS